MKLKVLPPTLRKNNRYLTIDIKIQDPITKDVLVGIIWDACIRFQGELNTSSFNLWVMRFYECGKTDEYYSYRAILRCQRGYVRQVRTALALVNNYNHRKIAISTIGLSGTIKASHKYI